jgi:hypothetical protein
VVGRGISSIGPMFGCCPVNEESSISCVSMLCSGVDCLIVCSFPRHVNKDGMLCTE